MEGVGYAYIRSLKFVDRYSPISRKAVAWSMADECSLTPVCNIRCVLLYAFFFHSILIRLAESVMIYHPGLLSAAVTANRSLSNESMFIGSTSSAMMSDVAKLMYCSVDFSRWSASDLLRPTTRESIRLPSASSMMIW